MKNIILNFGFRGFGRVLIIENTENGKKFECPYCPLDLSNKSINLIKNWTNNVL